MPRAGLSTDVVVAEAALLVDEVGYEQLTLAALARRFGVALPSLYKHIDGLGGLQRHLAVRAVRDLGDRLAEAAVGQATGDALRALAGAYRDFARAHPGRYAATVRAPHPDHGDHVAASQAVLRTVFAVLAGYGLDGGDLVDATRVVRSALHGFVALEGGGGFGLPDDVDRSFDRLVTALDSSLRSWPSPRAARLTG